MFESNENLASQQAPFKPQGDQAPTGRSPELRRLVGVQFRRAGVIHDFDAGDLPLGHDTRVVVDGERGEQLGWVVGTPEYREPFAEIVAGKVLRIATDDDLDVRRKHAEQEREALRWAASRVRESNFPMKMVAAEWSHSGGKITFYFSSEERPDFRDLVRDLAQRYRSRVEMRHVSPRDETKIVGALGPCGRETCCSSWLRSFSPVTIQMAKDQGLAINPQKVAGVCGRLLCCLAFEQESYAELRRKLPRYGRNVQTPKGRGRVVDVLTLRGRVRVQLEEDGSYVEFDGSEVIGGGKRSEEPTPQEVSTDSAPRHAGKRSAEGAAKRAPSRAVEADSASQTSPQPKVARPAQVEGAESIRTEEETESEPAPSTGRKRRRSRAKARARAASATTSPSESTTSATSTASAPTSRASTSTAATPKAVTPATSTPAAVTGAPAPASESKAASDRAPSRTPPGKLPTQSAPAEIEGAGRSGRSRTHRRKRSRSPAKAQEGTPKWARTVSAQTGQAQAKPARKSGSEGRPEKPARSEAMPSSDNASARRATSGQKAEAPKRSGGRSRTRRFRPKSRGPEKPES